MIACADIRPWWTVARIAVGYRKIRGRAPGARAEPNLPRDRLARLNRFRVRGQLTSLLRQRVSEGTGRRPNPQRLSGAVVRLVLRLIRD
jgi:hypothetical protein